MRGPIVAIAWIALAGHPAATLAVGPPNDCGAAAIPNQKARGKIGTVTFVPDRVTASTVNHPGLNGVTYDAYDLRFTMRDKTGEDISAR